MAQQQAPDDIFALYCRFDLDVSQYQVFERGKVELGETKKPVAAAPIVEPMPIEIPAAVEERLPRRAAPAKTPEVRKAQIPAERTGLRNLLNNLNQLHERSVTANFAMPCHPVNVFGSGGGVGVTTIMATLARQFSKQGFRCGLYDEAAESLLPLFFGMQRIAAQPTRFAGLQSVLEPQVRLLNADSLELKSSFQLEDAGVRERALQSLGLDFDVLITDQGRSSQKRADETTVFVALPDVSSVARIRNLTSTKGWNSKSENLICVLNRFDPEVGFHQELLAWYQQQFAHVVTIRHSYLVPEALAEGTSIFEWAPDSEVAADFQHLATRIHQVSGKSAPAPKNMEIPVQSTEGLALCS